MQPKDIPRFLEISISFDPIVSCYCTADYSIGKRGKQYAFAGQNALRILLHYVTIGAIA